MINAPGDACWQRRAHERSVVERPVCVVHCAEDFSPYWVLDRWTKEHTLADLKIMRAIGSSCIRVHITPPLPGATAYDRLSDRRTVPTTGEKYLELTDPIVESVNALGLRVHFHIGSSLSEVSEISVDG
jgi:hypothetical protein